MAPKKKKSHSSRTLKQASLLGMGAASSPQAGIYANTRASASKPVSPVKNKPKRSLRKTVPDAVNHSDSDSDLGAIKLQPGVSAKSSESEDSPHRPVKKRKTIVSDSDDIKSTTSQRGLKNAEIAAAPKRRWKGRTTRVHDSDSEGDKLAASKRRKIVRGKKPRPVSDDDDNDDIADEVEKDRILDTRLRARNKKTVFQKNLEKLKRKKQGLSSEPSSSEYDDEEESEDGNTPFKGAKPHSDRDSLFDEDSDATPDSSDFIVEDDSAVPASLPPQFSMDTHQDLAHQFKKVFQFFVHIAVRPAKERHNFMKQQIRDEEYFSVPLQITRRKISGLRDSLVASSVWRPEFKNPLESYPEFDLIPLDFAVPTCDACHLGGRMSTLTGRLSGFPYDRLGFEMTDESDSDSDSDSTGDKPTILEFHLGRFCAKRTRVFHEFTHWEYSLFKCIRQEVDELHASNQSGGFFRIAYAGGKAPPEDLGDADGICDWLDERKIIDVEWQKVKGMMESARHLEMAAKGGDDD